MRKTKATFGLVLFELRVKKLYFDSNLGPGPWPSRILKARRDWPLGGGASSRAHTPGIYWPLRATAQRPCYKQNHLVGIFVGLKARGYVRGLKMLVCREDC